MNIKDQLKKFLTNIVKAEGEISDDDQKIFTDVLEYKSKKHLRQEDAKRALEQKEKAED